MTVRIGKLALSVLLGLTIFLTGCQTSGQVTEVFQVPEGYRAVCWGDNAFMAVGTGGRIVRIHTDGSTQQLPNQSFGTLHDIAYKNGQYVVVGDGGLIAVAGPSGGFNKVESGTKNALLSVAVYGHMYVAVGCNGTVLTSTDGLKWTPLSVGVQNHFISVSAAGDTCLAVTREGQVLRMTGPSEWTVIDYNETHKNLATLVHMRGIASVSDRYYILATALDNEDMPVVFSTTKGELYTELNLERINDTLSGEFWPIRPNDALLFGDQVLVGADGGKLLTITDCSQCTKLSTTGDYNINGMASSPSGDVVVVGDGFKFNILDNGTVRMYSIKAPQALEDQKNGALIIDVRTAEEYIKGHIPGALHLPLSELADNLEKLVPDKNTKLIFYCAVGGRSEQAVQKAAELGYTRVYNLGGLESGDWPYSLETGEAGVFKAP